MARSTLDVPPPLRRVVARHAAAWLVCAVASAAGAGYAPAALAQEASGPIVIPGSGEQNPADLARMTAMATSSNSRSPRTINPQLAAAVAPSTSSTPQVTDRFTTLANANGAIVIPGTGEASAPGTRNAPASTIVIQQGSPANPAGLARINMNSALAASQVVPVVVTPAPARAAYGAALRPVNAAPAMAPAGIIAAAPVAAPASSVEIDSLASRGEPPELGASVPGRTAAPLQAQLTVKNKAQALAEAAQREQAIQALQQAQATQALQRAQTPQAAARPVGLAPASVQPVRTVASVQVSRPVQPQVAQPVQVQAAQPVPAGQEDGQLIHAAALDFLKQQANGLPGQVELSVAQAFPRGLAACDTLQAFMPPGARLWGRTTVGVRCASGHPWTVWLQAKVSIHATYYVAARAMLPGEVISEADLVAHDGDLTMLPLSIVTVPSQAVGSVTLMRVTAGLPLRQDMLKSAAEVTAGQSVRVVAEGSGFSISSEGSALSSATPGQPVRVRTSTGQILMGIVKDSSTVQIQM